MKKILYILLALMAFASCDKQALTDEVGQDRTDDGEFSFSIRTEDNSRAVSDLSRYIVALYKDNLSSTPVVVESATGTIDVKLDKTSTYICLFWADYGEDIYDATDLKAVVAKQGASGDKVAYFATETVSASDFKGTITLKRAVAELNFIDKAGFDATGKNLTITYPKTTFNVSDATINPSTTETVSQTYTGIGVVAASGKYATDYILAPATEGCISITMELKGYAAKTAEKVYIQTNYITNVKGKLTAPALDATRKLTVSGVDFNFVLVKAGTFILGSPIDEVNRDRRYESQHYVKLTQDFYISTTEVTQSQWKAVMGADNNPSNNIGDKYPVEKVTWYMINGGKGVAFEDSFLHKINTVVPDQGAILLPTESQWEYAAREGHLATDYYVYSGSNTANDVAWSSSNAVGATHEVGQLAPNALGLYDMSGNVGEWCSDWLYEDYPIFDINNPYVDPIGAAIANYKKIRGGNFKDNAIRSRNADRNTNIAPDKSDIHFGFRLVIIP